LVAGLVQDAGHSPGTGGQGRAAEQRVADALAAPVGGGLLEHQDGAAGVGRGGGRPRGGPWGCSARRRGPRAGTPRSPPAGAAGRGRRGRGGRGGAGRGVAGCPTAAGGGGATAPAPSGGSS